MSKTVNGFSKLSKFEKIEWLVSNFFNNDVKVEQTLKQYWNNTFIINLIKLFKYEKVLPIHYQNDASIKFRAFY